MSNQPTTFANAVNPYLSDVGVGLVFGLGYYLINYLYKDKKEDKKEAFEKINNKVSYESCTTTEDYNQLVKINEANEKLNPFELIEKMTKAHLSPDINTYNNLLNSCFIQGNFEYAEKLTEDLFDFASPVQPDLSTFNILLKGISYKIDYLNQDQQDDKDKQIKALDKILSQMSVLSETSTTIIKPNDVTINTSLDILIKAGETKRAWELFENMEKNYGVKPDKYSFSTIIKALKYDPNPEKLEKAFGIIELLKTESENKNNDEIIFNCLIDVCVRLQLMDKAETLFQEMKDLKVEPTKVTYAILIKGYGQVYDLEKAFSIFEEMKLANLPPNEIVYGCLLNACVKCSNLEKVTAVYQEMKLHKLEMNVVLYTTLIKAYTKVKDLNSALDVYYTMLSDSNVAPNIVVYNAILDCCVECQNTKKLNEIYQQIRDKAINANNTDNTPQPDLITYSTVIKGYARAKDIEKVFDIYAFLKENIDQFKLDEIIFNSILDGCAKTGNYTRAMDIHKDMSDLNIQKSNVTYSILVKIYSNAGHENKAMAILEEMKLKGIKPGIIVYTCLIQTCLKNKKPHKAVELFEEMKLTNKPDHVLYNTIINGCIYHQLFDAAAKYVIESFQRNIKIANDLYNTILYKLTANYCTLKHEKKIEYTSTIIRLAKEKMVNINEDASAKVAKLIYSYNGNDNNNNTNDFKRSQNYNNNKNYYNNNGNRGYTSYNKNNNANNNNNKQSDFKRKDFIKGGSIYEQ